MTLRPHSLKKLFHLPAWAVLACATVLSAQSQPDAPVAAPADAAASVKIFNDLADQALLAMKQRAGELQVKGVAVIAYVPGEDVNSWSSKMLVVGHMKTDSSTNSTGQNLLAIAYSKASEMADTLKPSGSHVRPPLKGEFGWQGGWIAPGKTGHLIAAFSGGRSEDDVKVSQAGVAVLAGSL